MKMNNPPSNSFFLFPRLLVLFLCMCFGCVSQDGRPGSAPFWIPSLSGASISPAPQATSEEEEEEEEEGPSTYGVALLYLPNRIFDALEMVRFGVNVGPGLGADLRATWVLNATAIHDSSVGVGFQGLRHLPVCARLGHTALGAGPIKADVGLWQWPINEYDIRAELYLLLVGAHVAIDLEAIFDFFAGLLTFDPTGDDFIWGG